jgi:superfamily I DNA/RNA helicase
MNLNAPQKEAVRTEGNLAILAVPGSGKTATSIAKTITLLNASKTNCIAIVVFNRDAAIEIKERIKKGKGDIKRLVLGTYHSLALSHLRAIGWKGKILTGSAQKHMIYRAWERTHHPCPPEEAPQWIDRIKGDYLRYTNSQAHEDKYEDEPAFDMYIEYNNLLSSYGMADFTDIIAKSLYYFVKGEVDSNLARVTHLIADEFQDTDALQYAWLSRLQNATKSIITVVGDDDQTIYGFRNAMGIQGFHHFQHDYNPASVTLNINYRSHSEIIESARKLIENNTDRVPKNYVAHKGDGGEVSIRMLPKPEDEHDAITQFIRQSESKTLAVLARTNRKLQALQDYLNDSKVLYSRRSGQKFWDLPAPSALLEIITSLLDGTPIGFEQYLMLIGENEKSISRYQLHIHKNIAERIENPAFQEMMKHISAHNPATDNGLNALIAAVTRSLVVNIKWDMQSLKKYQKPHLEASSRILQKLRGKWKQRVQLVNSVDNNPLLPQLTTFHGSKGLEYDSVWIMGASHDAIPPEQSIEAGEIDEERRLFFVAMTRAERKLVISYSGQQCRFIDEILFKS